MPFSRSHVSSVEILSNVAPKNSLVGNNRVPFDPSEISNSQDSSNRSALSVQDNNPVSTMMAMKNKNHIIKSLVN